MIGVDKETVALKLRVRPLSEVVARDSSSSSTSSSPSNTSPSSSSSSPYDLETAWLWICWKPGAARACLGPEPPRGSPADGFASTARLREELRGRVLTSVAMRRRWERVLVLAFSRGSGNSSWNSTDAKGGGERGLYGDEVEEDDPYAAAAAADRKNKKRTKTGAAEKKKKTEPSGGNDDDASSSDSDGGGPAAPDRLLFLEAMGRRSNMVLTEVRQAFPTAGSARFALAAAEAAALNEQGRQKRVRAASKAARVELPEGSTKKEQKAAARAAIAEADKVFVASVPASFLPLPPGKEFLPDRKKLPPIPRPVPIPPFYESSPAAAAAAASYPPSKVGEAASLGISGASASSALSTGGGGGGGGPSSSSSSSAFSVPQLIPSASAAKPGRVLALGRSVPLSASRARPLIVGGQYRSPPRLATSEGGRLEPGMSETREVWRSNVLGAAEALREQKKEHQEQLAAAKLALAAKRAKAAAAEAAAAEGSDPDSDGSESKLEVQLEGEEAPPPPPPVPTPGSGVIVSTAVALVAAYSGVSPSLAQELCWAAGIRGNGAYVHGPDDDVERVLLFSSEGDADAADAACRRLHAVWRNWLCAVAEARFAPGRAHDGAPSVLGGGVLLEESKGDFAAPSAPCDIGALLAAAGGVDLALRESLAVSFLFVFFFLIIHSLFSFYLFAVRQRCSVKLIKYTTTRKLIASGLGKKLIFTLRLPFFFFSLLSFQSTPLHLLTTPRGP